jgi:hypothetical protein
MSKYRLGMMNAHFDNIRLVRILPSQCFTIFEANRKLAICQTVVRGTGAEAEDRASKSQIVSRPLVILLAYLLLSLCSADSEHLNLC